MYVGRKVVVTTYGHDNNIDKIAVSVFEDTDRYNSSYSNAASYCCMINSLELKEGSWVNAKIISENTPFLLNSFLPRDFSRLINILDQRALQNVLREVDSKTLSMALINAKNELKEKVFSNMSERAAKMLKEDIECVAGVRLEEVEEARQKIVTVIKHLEDVGIIVINEAGEK